MALRLALAGHRVLLGSRDPEKAAGVVAELLGGRDLPVEGVGNPDAAAGADVVFLVFPYAGQADVLRAGRADRGQGRGGCDQPARVGPAGALPAGGARGERGRAGGRPAAAGPGGCRLPPCRPRLLADPEREVETDVLVASDDPGAKGLVLELADQIPGCRGVDAGPLRMARHLEGFTAVIVGINRRYRIHAGLRISRLGDDKRRRLNAELRPAGDREEGP